MGVCEGHLKRYFLRAGRWVLRGADFLCTAVVLIAPRIGKHLKTLFMRFPNYRNELSGCEEVNKSEAKKYRFLEARSLS